MAIASLKDPADHVDATCDKCGKRFEARAEKCVHYKTKKVGDDAATHDIPAWPKEGNVSMAQGQA